MRILFGFLIRIVVTAALDWLLSLWWRTQRSQARFVRHA